MSKVLLFQCKLGLGISEGTPPSHAVQPTGQVWEACRICASDGVVGQWASIAEQCHEVRRTDTPTILPPPSLPRHSGSFRSLVAVRTPADTGLHSATYLRGADETCRRTGRRHFFGSSYVPHAIRPVSGLCFTRNQPRASCTTHMPLSRPCTQSLTKTLNGNQAERNNGLKVAVTLFFLSMGRSAPTCLEWLKCTLFELATVAMSALGSVCFATL